MKNSYLTIFFVGLIALTVAFSEEMSLVFQREFERTSASENEIETARSTAFGLASGCSNNPEEEMTTVSDYFLCLCTSEV